MPLSIGSYRHLFAIFCVLTCLLVTGCAADSGYLAGKHILGIPGFFGGIFHGLITLPVLIPWAATKLLLNVFGCEIMDRASEFQLYADVHTSGYPWGYWLGFFSWFIRTNRN